MRGLYHRLQPFTPDSSGAAAVFADLPALIIMLDMNGTVSTFRNRVGVPEDSPVRVCSTLGFREMSYVLGDDREFVGECLDLISQYGGEFVVLLHGPVSSMVGLDVRGFAQRLQDESGLRVLAVECTGNEGYDKGVSAALMAIFDCLEQEDGWAEGRAEKAGVNLLGLNRVDHNDERACNLLFRAVEDTTSGGIVSVWGCLDGWEKWRNAGNARENIVASNCGLALAKALERRWGTPYRFLDDVGLVGICGVQGAFEAGLGGARPKSPARVLVVHEQVTANLVRAELERAMGSEWAIDVACFHAMRRERRRDSDVRLKSEGELVGLLAERTYDWVIGDPALASCLPEGTGLVELGFSAIARVAEHNGEGPAPLSREWFDYACRRLGGSRSADAKDVPTVSSST